MTDAVRPDPAAEHPPSGSTESRLTGLADDIVRTISQPLLILDDDFRVVAANPAFYDSFQVGPDETLDTPVFELGSGEWDIPGLRELLLEIIPRDTSIEDFEVEHDFEALGSRIMLVSARRLRRRSGGGGASELILLAIEDVTERRRAEEELHRSNEDLERFAYHASHDLQEPLRMVASYTQLLARRYEGELDEKADKYIRYAIGGAERMKALINDLLEYSRVGARGAVAEPTDAEAMLHQVLDDLGRRVERSGAQVTHDPLPPAEVDPGQLRRVFQNLVENAIKFSGDAPPVIHVSGRQDEDRVVYSVRDEGVGIEAEHLDRVFGMFQRLEGRDTPGTGLGLALCRKIVEQHGGEIRVESEPGEGSTFYFSLPATDEVPEP